MPGSSKPTYKGVKKKKDLSLCLSNRSLPGLVFISGGFLLFNVRGASTARHLGPQSTLGNEAAQGKAQTSPRPLHRPVFTGVADVSMGSAPGTMLGAGLLDLPQTYLG